MRNRRGLECWLRPLSWQVKESVAGWQLWTVGFTILPPFSSNEWGISQERKGSVTEMFSRSLQCFLYLWGIVQFVFRALSTLSHRDVKHWSSSTLGPDGWKCFHGLLWPDLLEGGVQFPKGTSEDIFHFLTCSICVGWLLWLQPDPFKYHQYSRARTAAGQTECASCTCAHICCIRHWNTLFLPVWISQTFYTAHHNHVPLESLQLVLDPNARTDVTKESWTLASKPYLHICKTHWSSWG